MGATFACVICRPLSVGNLATYVLEQYFPFFISELGHDVGQEEFQLTLLSGIHQNMSTVSEQPMDVQRKMAEGLH